MTERKPRKPRDAKTFNVEGMLRQLPPDRGAGGATTVFSTRLEVADAAFLAAQEHGRSYQIRQAVEGYLAEFENVQAIAKALNLQPGEAIAYCIRQAAAPPPF